MSLSLVVDEGEDASLAFVEADEGEDASLSLLLVFFSFFFFVFFVLGADSFVDVAAEEEALVVGEGAGAGLVPLGEGVDEEVGVPPDVGVDGVEGGVEAPLFGVDDPEEASLPLLASSNVSEILDAIDNTGKRPLEASSEPFSRALGVSASGFFEGFCWLAVWEPPA